MTPTPPPPRGRGHCRGLTAQATPWKVSCQVSTGGCSWHGGDGAGSSRGKCRGSGVLPLPSEDQGGSVHAGGAGQSHPPEASGPRRPPVEVRWGRDGREDGSQLCTGRLEGGRGCSENDVLPRAGTRASSREGPGVPTQPRARGRTHPGQDRRCPGCPGNPGARFLQLGRIRVRMGEKDAVSMGEGDSGGRPRTIPTARPLSVPPDVGLGRLHGEGRQGQEGPRAQPEDGEGEGVGVGPGGPRVSSGSPGRHPRRKRGFPAPVRTRGAGAQPTALRALCGKARDRRRASPLRGPGERGSRRAGSGRGGGSGATYGRGGEGGGGGPSAGPGRRDRTAEAPRLRRAGLRWAPSWSAPRAAPRRPGPCIIGDSPAARRAPPRRRAPRPPRPRAPPAPPARPRPTYPCRAHPLGRAAPRRQPAR